jgi:hypothetical protein
MLRCSEGLVSDVHAGLAQGCFGVVVYSLAEGEMGALCCCCCVCVCVLTAQMLLQQQGTAVCAA